jgi:hypothetical protein
MQRSLAAALLFCAPLVVPAHAELPEPGAAVCETKAESIAYAERAIPAAIITDLAGTVEEFFATNLERVSAYDTEGADIVLIRRPGSGQTLILMFKSGCYSGWAAIDNLMVQPLMAAPDDEGV